MLKNEKHSTCDQIWKYSAQFSGILIRPAKGSALRPLTGCLSKTLIFIAMIFSFFTTVTAFNYTLPPTPDIRFRDAPPIQFSTLRGPAFIVNASTNYSTVVQGSTAVLTCAIRNLHNFTVSWVRSQNTRLLTIGDITYTSEKRFVASNPRRSKQWILKIHYATMDDSGIYLCQVSTTPPIMLPVNLKVVEVLLRVHPGREVHVQLGSRLELECEVEGCRGRPLISWSRVGNPLKDEDLLKMVTRQDEASGLGEAGSTSLSRLTLSHSKADPDHSGIYTCTSSCTSQAINVSVHVLKGEELAAMQHHNDAAAAPTTGCATLLVMAILFIVARAAIPQPVSSIRIGEVVASFSRLT